MKAKRIFGAMLAAVMLSNLTHLAIANEWDNNQRAAYDGVAFGRGITQPYSTQELVIDEATEYKYFDDLSAVEEQSVKDKIIVLGSSSERSYDELISHIRELGAVGLIVEENDRSKRYRYHDGLAEENRDYPFLLLDQAAVEYLKQTSGQKLITKRPHEETMNTYSSWGVSSDFVMKPDLIAPGTVFAPFSRLNPDSADQPPFGVLEGTSMSTPTVAGANLLVKQYFQQLAPQLEGESLARAIRTQLQNTALAHRDQNFVLTSPRWQGAGNLNVDLATANPLLVHTPQQAEDEESGYGKVNLRDTIRPDGPSSKVIDFTLQLDNLGTETVALKNAEAVLLVDNVVDGRVGAGSKEVKRVSLITPTVPGGESTTLSVNIPFEDELTVGMKDIAAASPNGFFVEGFVLLEYENPTMNAVVELSIPFLGFYGDWMKVPVIERSIYDRTDRNDIPYYGAFSAVKQDGGGDFSTPHMRPMFTHFYGLQDTETRVLGADWNFDLADLSAVELDEAGEVVTDEAGNAIRRQPQSVAVRGDKIAVSRTGNGVKDIHLVGPALRNWLDFKIALLEDDEELVSSADTAGTTSKRYKDHGQWGATSQWGIDDNKIKRLTRFGSLVLSNKETLTDGVYTLRVQVRPDSFDMHNPVVAQDAHVRNYEEFWQTQDYSLIVDSLAPTIKSAAVESSDQTHKVIQVNATDDGSGVKRYVILNDHGQEIQANQTGEFTLTERELQGAWIKIEDYAYNYVQERLVNRLDKAELGELKIITNAPDGSFATSYYAVSTATGNAEYTSLQTLPAGEYDIYLLNPTAGYRPDHYHQRVTVEAGEETRVTFNFTKDDSQTYYLDMQADLTFEQFEERLAGLSGSTYEMILTDVDNGMRYTFSPSRTKKPDLIHTINQGKYRYEMPWLRVWSTDNPDYSSDKKNWKVGVFQSDNYAYTSDVPLADRPQPWEVIETRNLAGVRLEYFFYLEKLSADVLRPIPINPSNLEYVLGSESIEVELGAERSQNPNQFRLLLPARLASDPDISEDDDLWTLIGSGNIELNSYSDYMETSTSDNGLTRIKWTIPEKIRSKLVAGDQLLVQELDEAWKPYEDHQLVYQVVAAPTSGSETESQEPSAPETESPAAGNSNQAPADEFENEPESLSEGETEDPQTPVEQPQPNSLSVRQSTVKVPLRQPAAPLTQTETGKTSETEGKTQAVYMRANIRERLNEAIGYKQAWKRGFKGQGTLIAFIDNGIEFTHPSFQKAAADASHNKITSGEQLQNLISERKSSAEGGKFVLDGTYVNEKLPYVYNYYLRGHSQDDMLAGGDNAYQHGAHVAGIAAANPNYPQYPQTYRKNVVRDGEETTIDVPMPKFEGVAPEAQIVMMSVSASDSQRAESSSLYAQCIYDAVALGADAISVSLGYGAGTNTNIEDSLRDAVEYARDRGVLVYFAMGNSGYYGYAVAPANELRSRYLYDLQIRPYAENPDYGVPEVPAVYSGVVSIGGYGVNLFPPVDNARFNPFIAKDTYTQPYYNAYRNHRLYVVQTRQPEPTPEPSTEPSESTPSPEPSAKPSAEPTPVPTVEPKPSEPAPIPQPTVVPSPQPTIGPAPVPQPTAQPSEPAPTPEPSPKPSEPAPTGTPTPPIDTEPRDPQPEPTATPPAPEPSSSNAPTPAVSVAPSATQHATPASTSALPITGTNAALMATVSLTLMLLGVAWVWWSRANRSARPLPTTKTEGK